MYSSYLPVLAKASQFAGINSNNEAKNDTYDDNTTTEDKNDTFNELEDPFEWDSEKEEVKPREGTFIYFLEFFGSILQLLWGGITALFTGSTGTS